MIDIRQLPIIPACHAYQVNSQNIPTGTDTAIIFDAESFDNDNIHDNSTNNTRLTCRTSGIYRISAIAWYGGGAGTYRYSYISLNRSMNLAVSQITQNAANAYALGATLTTNYALSANDYIELFMSHDKGSDIVTGVGPGYTHLCMEMITSF